jgi:hypothetical protein
VKNLSRAYMNHPELVWVFLTILLLSMFLLPFLQCHFYRKKQNKLRKLSELSKTVCSDSTKSKVACTFCSSQRVIEEVLFVSPLNVKYRLFFPKTSGITSLVQLRCGVCGTGLVSYLQNTL